MIRLLKFVLVLFLVSLLYPYGTDVLQYSIIYNGINSWSHYVYLEPSFRGLILFSHYIGLNISGFYLFITGLTLLPVIYVTSNSRYSIAFLYYLSVFFFPYMINGIRQSIAMGLGLLAIYMFNKGFNRKAIGLVFVAGSFHFGAVIYFLYFLFASISKKASMAVIILILVFISVFSLSIFGVGSSSISVFDVLYRFTLVVVLWLFTTKENEHLLIFYLAGFLIFLSLYFDAQLAARVHFYFRIIDVLVFAYPLKRMALSRATAVVFTLVFLISNLFIYV